MEHEKTHISFDFLGHLRECKWNRSKTTECIFENTNDMLSRNISNSCLEIWACRFFNSIQWAVRQLILHPCFPTQPRQFSSHSTRHPGSGDPFFPMSPRATTTKIQWDPSPATIWDTHGLSSSRLHQSEAPVFSETRSYSPSTHVL
jgi:hypothetical protein